MSGPLQLLLGGAAPQITISNVTANAVVASPTTATAQYELTSGGDIRRTTTNNVVSDQGDWITPKVTMSSYDARMTMVSGTLTSGTVGSFVNLGTTRTWTLQALAGGTSDAVATLDIRNASGAIVATATITFHAESTP